MQALATSRVYEFAPRDHSASRVFIVNSYLVQILFDPGTSYSFISHAFMYRLQLVTHPLDVLLSVSTPFREVSLLESICRRCVISIDEFEFIFDLVIL